MSLTISTPLQTALHFADPIYRGFEKGQLSLGTLFGGKSMVGKIADSPGFDSFAWSDFTREGMPRRAVDRFQSLCFSEEPAAFYRLIGTSLRTAQRHKASDADEDGSAMLSPDVSARAVTLAHLILRSIDAFGSPAKAQQWWARPNTSLGGRLPIQMADNLLGIRAIEDTLTSIEHGFFA